MAIAQTLSDKEIVNLLLLASVSFGVLLKTFQGDGQPIVASIAFSAIAFSATYSMIVWLGKAFLAAGLKGQDVSKRRKVEMCAASNSDPLLEVLLIVSHVKSRSNGSYFRSGIPCNNHHFHTVCLL